MMVDISLVARAQAGEEAAFAEIVARYERELGVFLYRHVHNAHAAEDLLQDTFTAAWRALPRTSPDLLLRPWLYKIALNMARQWERRERIVRWIPLHLLHAPTEAEDPSQRDEVRQVLARMKREDAEVLLLRITAGLTYSDIGALLRLKPETVRQRFHRARERFRSIYATERSDT